MQISKAQTRFREYRVVLVMADREKPEDEHPWFYNIEAWITADPQIDDATLLAHAKAAGEILDLGPGGPYTAMRFGIAYDNGETSFWGHFMAGLEALGLPAASILVREAEVLDDELELVTHEGLLCVHAAVGARQGVFMFGSEEARDLC